MITTRAPDGANKIQNLIVKDEETGDVCKTFEGNDVCKTFDVSFLGFHHGWDRKKYTNDIAILTLNRPITRSCFRLSIHINICSSGLGQLFQYASPRHLSNSLTRKPMS